MNFEQTIHIERPAEEVFAYVTDPTHLPEWDRGIRHAHVITSPPTRVGTEVAIERTVPPFNRTARFVGQVEAHEPPRRFAITVTDGPVPYSVSYRFAGDEDSTTMRIAVESRPKGLLRAVEPRTRRLVRRQVRSYYRRLRQILESSPHGREHR